MTDFNRLGEELRAELGEPPPSFTDRQRLRLRGLDLSPAPSRRPQLLTAAAVAAGVILTAGGYFWLNGAQPPQEQTNSGSTLERDQVGGPESEALWVEAQAEPVVHPLGDGGSIELAAGARGRLDQRSDEGTRFDLHEGTATFSVRKKLGREFSVVAGQYRVIVVGTQFTTAYLPPSRLSVAVHEGTVQVYLPDRPDAISVSRNERLEIEGREFSLGNQGNAPDASREPQVEESNGPPASQTSNVSWQHLYHQGKYEPACKAARTQSIPQLQGRLDAGGLTELAGALRLCGDAETALLTLQTLRKRYPGSASAHDALFTIGRIHATSGNPQGAISHLRQYLEGAGSGRFAAEALGRLMELHKAQGNRQVAREYARKYLQVAPQGPYRKLAESMATDP